MLKFQTQWLALLVLASLLSVASQSPRPSGAPSMFPSAQTPHPSDYPTFFPTLSVQPTGLPSIHPSAYPSRSAQPSQSTDPSAQPSLSFQPSQSSMPTSFEPYRAGAIRFCFGSSNADAPFLVFVWVDPFQDDELPLSDFPELVFYRTFGPPPLVGVADEIAVLENSEISAYVDNNCIVEEDDDGFGDEFFGDCDLGLEGKACADFTYGARWFVYGITSGDCTNSFTFVESDDLKSLCDRSEVLFPATTPACQSDFPSMQPSASSQPSATPSAEPSAGPSAEPSAEPSDTPSAEPSAGPSDTPSVMPSSDLSAVPSGKGKGKGKGKGTGKDGKAGRGVKSSSYYPKSSTKYPKSSTKYPKSLSKYPKSSKQPTKAPKSAK